MAARTWLAVSLCLLIWLGYLQWFAPLPPQPPPQQSEQPVENGVAPKGGTQKSAQGLFSAPDPTAGGTITQLKTPTLEIEFGRSGDPLTIGLLNYRETPAATAPTIKTINPSQMPYFLKPQFSALDLADISMKPLSGGCEEKSCRFEGVTEKVTVTKHHDVLDKYRIQTKVTLRFKEQRRDWGDLVIPVGGTSLTYDANVPLEAWEVVWRQDGKVSRQIVQKIEENSPVIKQGNSQWLALGNRYFSTAVINRSETNPDIVLNKTNQFLGAYFKYPIRLKEGQQQIEFIYEVYSGPKEISELATVEGLTELIDYGMFTWLAVPLLELLRFFYRFIHNYGWAIILLTVVVRLVFYPLSAKSYRSMKSMQKLQPQIQALKEKYKEDMQRFNQEQMALFKAHKVNPLGGCLPMLVQLPVFIALYAVLGNSIELFQTPFFGWIHDLSSKDPYYVYPVLMGVAMFLQTKMTPSPGMDPIQQKMMLFMPIFFSFFMINLPSGLTLYIFVSTLLGILQQVVMMRNRSIGTNSPLAVEKG